MGNSREQHAGMEQKHNTSEDKKLNKDLTLSLHADTVSVAVGAQRPIMHRPVHGNHCRRLLGLTEETTVFLSCRETDAT